MKPIKNSIPIRELQTLLRQWRRKGLKEGVLLKVLELYLGLPNYMNEQGVYPVYFFYDLAASLKFRTAGNMLDAVKLAGCFGFEPGDNKLNIACFWSPLWKDLPDSTAVDAAKLLQNLQRDNIYNNINNSLDTPFDTPLPLSRGEDPSEAIDTPLPLSRGEEGRKFFLTIKTNPAERAEVLDPLIVFFQQQAPDVPREEACADVVHLVNELLIPHFVAQEKFLRMKHNGRLAWLKNLLKTAHGRELMKQAAEAGKQRRSLQRKQALDAVKQNNRPLSPYEWMDPETKTRFYEDESEGVVVIPVGAPPRPSESAFFNVIKQCWV